jgi:ParB family chromosome partitioning protein
MQTISTTEEGAAVTAKALQAARFSISAVEKLYSKLPVTELEPGRFQSRKSFDQNSLRELADSLKATEINFVPVVVRPLDEGRYEIICGERRWRAAQMIGLESLLCCIGNFSDQQANYLCAVENIQRENLNPVEQAEAYKRLSDAGLTHQEMAEELGQSRSHITNYLRLLTLPLQVRSALVKGDLSFAQARPLCSLDSPGIQKRIASDAIRLGWSVKKIEQAISAAKLELNAATISRPGKGSEDVDIARLRNLVSEQTGYPCVIVRTQSGGWQLGLSATSTEEFSGILERLGVNTEAF